MLLLKLILILIFCFLSGLHFYWASGGKWALADSIPTATKDTTARRPPTFATIIVALGLLGFSLFYLNQTAWLNISLPIWFFKLGSYGIPIIFLLRAVGEFKYVGFFKSIKDTSFAQKDSSIYSSLSLVIALVGAAIVLGA